MALLEAIIRLRDFKQTTGSTPGKSILTLDSKPVSLIVLGVQGMSSSICPRQRMAQVVAMSSTGLSDDALRMALTCVQMNQPLSSSGPTSPFAVIEMTAFRDTLILDADRSEAMMSARRASEALSRAAELGCIVAVIARRTEGYLEHLRSLFGTRVWVVSNVDNLEAKAETKSGRKKQAMGKSLLMDLVGFAAAVREQLGVIHSTPTTSQIRKEISRGGPCKCGDPSCTGVGQTARQGNMLDNFLRKKCYLDCSFLPGRGPQVHL